MCAETDDLVINEIHKDLFIPGTNKRKAPTGLTDKEIKVTVTLIKVFRGLGIKRANIFVN